MSPPCCVRSCVRISAFATLVCPIQGISTVAARLRRCKVTGRRRWRLARRVHRLHGDGGAVGAADAAAAAGGPAGPHLGAHFSPAAWRPHAPGSTQAHGVITEQMPASSGCQEAQLNRQSKKKASPKRL
jgi:hypothetical protein